MKRILAIYGMLLIGCCKIGVSQEIPSTNKEDGAYQYKDCKINEALPVSNQNKSGTCWSFSGLSFFESEMIRMGGKAENLSEMYIVRKAYTMKAQRYLWMHGRYQFGPGGQFHDIVEVAKVHGLLPESAYPGKALEYGKPVHNELDAVAKSMVEVAVERPNKTLSENWWVAYESMLDAYLGGTESETNPQEYLKSTGLDMDDYVEITSFTHMPMYSQELLFIPDNWTMSKYYNVPLDDLTSIVDHAIDQGYTVAWDADVSDRGFSFKNGLAVVPEVPWSVMDKAQKDTIFNDWIKEREITVAERQRLFENYETTDDHLMHIVGRCKDQKGNAFYLTKNSWGTDRNDCKGYFYTSGPYFKLKTIAIMVHKDAIPKAIRKKLGI